MLRSDIYDREDREHAMDEAFSVLDSVFNTSYTQTKTPVTYTDQEMNWWFFQWEKGGYDYRFEWNLWSGATKLSRKEDGVWKALVKHE